MAHQHWNAPISITELGFAAVDAEIETEALP